MLVTHCANHYVIVLNKTLPYLDIHESIARFIGAEAYPYQKSFKGIKSGTVGNVEQS